MNRYGLPKIRRSRDPEVPVGEITILRTRRRAILSIFFAVLCFPFLLPPHLSRPVLFFCGSDFPSTLAVSDDPVAQSWRPLALAPFQTADRVGTSALAEIGWMEVGREQADSGFNHDLEDRCGFGSWGVEW